MRLALVHLGRRGSGGPISLSLAAQLSRHVELLAVLSSQADVLPAWRETDIELAVVETYASLPRALWGWLDRSRVQQIAAVIRAWKPDALLFPMFYTWNPLVQHDLPGIPSVIFVHDPVAHPGLRGVLYRLIEDWSIRQASRCVLLSSAFIPSLARRGATQEQVDVIPHGDFSFYVSSVLSQPTPSAANDSEPVILFFGRIEPYKGLEVLLQAYQKLCALPGLKVKPRLRIVGEGSLRPYGDLLSRLPRLEITNRYVGHQEIPEIFQTASIVVLPYLNATQSGLIPLAAAFKKAVVATRTGGLPEQIADQRTGLLVAPGSVDELAEALLRLVSNPEMASRLGDSLGQHYQAGHGWEKISVEVLESCRKAALRQAAGPQGG